MCHHFNASCIPAWCYLDLNFPSKFSRIHVTSEKWQHVSDLSLFLLRGVLDHEKYINSVLGLYCCNILCLQNSADACIVILCEYKLQGGKNKLEAAREKKLYGVIQSAAWKIIKCGLSV